jgi:hypothetical protein
MYLVVYFFVCSVNCFVKLFSNSPPPDSFGLVENAIESYLAEEMVALISSTSILELSQK